MQLLLGGKAKSGEDFIAKDFLIKKLVPLIAKVLAELRKQEYRLNNEVLADSMLEQVRWTIYLVKDREVQKKLSPQMQLFCLEQLTQSFRAFSPLPQAFIDQCLPGLSSVATHSISGDIKNTLKVRLAMVDLWQVTLRNAFEDFSRKLEQFNRSEVDKQRREMLLVKSAIEEAKEGGTSAYGLPVDALDESIVKLSECFGHIGKQLYRSLDQPQLLKELNFLTKMFIEGVKTEFYPQLFVNLAVLCLLTGAN